MVKVLTILTLLVLLPSAAPAAELPALSYQYAPVLVSEQRQYWPKAPQPWTLAGLVEQETCITLTSSRCWNPRTELKTPREYGFGLGQVTMAYRADGSVIFNKFEELRRAHSSLSGWTWAGRFDPRYQLRAIVEMVHGLYGRVLDANTATAQWAFTLSAYNGGMGGLLQDRLLCRNTAGCNPGLWFGNVADHSLKSKVPQPAYGGQSWFSINRGYVKNVLEVRRSKYRPFWGCAT